VIKATLPRFWPNLPACVFAVLAILFLFACGSGGAAPSYGVGGTVSGLSPSTSLVLTNGGASVTVSANGAFIFQTLIGQGSSYNITVSTQPAWQRCVVTNGSGTGIAANALSASVVCSAAHYSYVVNYGNNQIWHYNVDNVTGILTPTVFITTDNHPSGIAVYGNYAYVTHFGSKQISQYSIDPLTGNLTEVTNPGTRVATGVNPNGIAISPSGHFAYVSNGADNTISKYAIDTTTGALTEATTLTTRFATGATPNGLTLSPNGNFLYATNNAKNAGTTMSSYSVNASGDLTALAAPATGLGPTGVAMMTNGSYAYASNYVANTITHYAADAATGALTAGVNVATGNNPSAVAVSPFGNFAYAANWADSTISQYTINVANGALTVIAGMPALAGSQPDGIAFR
jgi:6-phosphogluconolactonase (cycloisomerase 2 family)